MHYWFDKCKSSSAAGVPSLETKGMAEQQLDKDGLEVDSTHERLLFDSIAALVLLFTAIIGRLAEIQNMQQMDGALVVHGSLSGVGGLCSS